MASCGFLAWWICDVSHLSAMLCCCTEYVSLFVDEEPLFDGRTPLQIYSDFMNAYAQAMAPFIKDGTIAEIEVGMGPAGELRYPAYRTPWTFCGIGEFQASGSYALANLKAAATAAGNADWGNGRWFV